MRLSLLFICISAILMPALTISAQQTGRATGKVVDKQNGDALIGASVVFENSDSFYGGTADEIGNFRIENIQPGIYSIRVSSIGFDPLLIPEFEIKAGKNEIPFFELAESATAISEVVVHSVRKIDDEPQNPMAVASARAFTMETTERYAASLRDPGRLVLSFAGVRMQSDIVNGIIVRGNAPKGVLWRVEGIDVPDPNHFSQEGYGGGAVCMISGQAIGRSDFFTGAFPAEYGNAMSAVFDIKLRKGDILRRRYYAQAGMMGFEGGIEGPFIMGKNASYIINYRYSTLKLLEKMGLDVGNTISTYQDLNFKLNFPTKKAGTFSLFGIGGMSELVNYNERRNKTNEKTKTYDMAVVGLSNAYSLNLKNHLRTTVAFSANRESLDKDEIYRSNMIQPSYRMGASNLYIRGNVELDTRLTPKTAIATGFTASGLRFKIKDIFDFTRITDEYKGVEMSWMLQAHSQVKHALTEKWTLLGGMHVLYFGYNGNYSIEPRGGVNWQIHQKHAIFFATGLHSRMESLALYMVNDPWQFSQPNRDLGFTRAFHAVLGYEFIPLENLKLKTELYYQYLYDVPISTDESSYFSMLNFQDRYTTMKLVNSGLGKNYGIELTMEKSFSHNYYILANASLFTSQYYAADGVWRNTRFNANFVNSLTTGKDFPFGEMKSWVFGANARILWAGGERTEHTQFEEQIRSYFRMDTRFSISRKKDRVKWLLAVDIQNTTNHENENTLEDIKPIGILPVLSFRVEM